MLQALMNKMHNMQQQMGKLISMMAILRTEKDMIETKMIKIYIKHSLNVISPEIIYQRV